MQTARRAGRSGRRPSIRTLATLRIPTSVPRRVKGRMGAVGMWGDYCEREGHGEYVKWESKSSGTLKKVVVPVRDAQVM